VVITCYACCGCNIEGRWRASAYDPITPMQSKRASTTTLGSNVDREHPIMRGVKSFEHSGTNEYVYGPGPVSANSRLIADLDATDPGRRQIKIPFIVERLWLPGRVVTVNLLFSADQWDKDSDGPRIVANALLYAGGRKIL